VATPNSADTNDPAVAATVCSRSSSVANRVTASPATEPRAISGASGPRTAEAQRAQRGERHAEAVRDRRRPTAEARERRVAAVPGQPGARDRDDGGAGDRQPEHHVPRHRLVPEPVLELVHEREEPRGEQRRRQADQRSEGEQPQVSRHVARERYAAPRQPTRCDHPKWVIPTHPAAQEDRGVADVAPTDEVARLNDEVERLRSALDRRAAWTTRGRRAALAFLLVLGCGLVAMSLIAIYVRVTVLNTDRYVETMAPIARSPAVQHAVADKLDAAITSRVDVDALLRDALPPRADPLAPALATGLQQAIRSRIDTFVASDRFPQLWDDANRRVHSRVVDLLSAGKSKRLTLQGDTVYLDLGAAVDRVRQALSDRGLDRPAAAIPPSVDGRVTLLKSEGFVKARRGVHLLEGLAIVLPILALLCLAGHVALSRPRRRGLLRVGLGLVVTALLLLALVGIGRSLYLDAISQNVLPRDAAAEIFDSLIALLRTGVRVVAVAAVVIALIALVLGRAGAIAAYSRRAFANLATDQRVSWVAEHRGVLQGVVAGVGALVLFSWSPPTAGVVLIDAALVAAAVALIAAIARAPGRISRP
jgi:hypothetical protein